MILCMKTVIEQDLAGVGFENFAWWEYKREGLW